MAAIALEPTGAVLAGLDQSNIFIGAKTAARHRGEPPLGVRRPPVSWAGLRPTVDR